MPPLLSSFVIVVPFTVPAHKVVVCRTLNNSPFRSFCALLSVRVPLFPLPGRGPSPAGLGFLLINGWARLSRLASPPFKWLFVQS